MVLFGFSREEEDDFLAFSVSKKVSLAPLSHHLKLVGEGSLACHHHGLSVQLTSHMPQSYNLQLQRKS